MAIITSQSAFHRPSGKGTAESNTIRPVLPQRSSFECSPRTNHNDSSCPKEVEEGEQRGGNEDTQESWYPERNLPRRMSVAYTRHSQSATEAWL